MYTPVHVVVKACRAPDAADDCRQNALAGLEVLRHYDIANVTSAQQEWWGNRSTYALRLEDADSGEPLGGVRLQRWGNEVPLPLEAALRRIDARVHGWIAGFAEHGVGELCGLWRSPKLRGFGLGARLTAMGLALAAEVHVQTVFGLCDARQVPDNVRFGFAVDPALASRGVFEYPRPGLHAHVLRLDDARGLPGASPEARAAILQYRELPVGREEITRAGSIVNVSRDLRIAAVTGTVTPTPWPRPKLRGVSS